MYTMMQVCREVGITYQTLKFYCNEGLVPNVKRDKNNRRVFGERDVKWIRDLSCLKKCGMTIQEMKEYPALCLEDERSIPPRKEMLAKNRRRCGSPSRNWRTVSPRSTGSRIFTTKYLRGNAPMSAT